MKKLISMTDFVLEVGNPEHTDYQFANLVMAYANFLKKTLTLGMFVPCDEDGNVLKEPREDDYSFYTHKNISVKEQYQQAKERVLFYGFEKYRVDKRGFLIYDIGFDACEVKSLNKNTIEDLVGRNITLTPYALKQIGL